MPPAEYLVSNGMIGETSSGIVWLANCYGRADFTGNRAAQVNWLSLSERIPWR